ncbi:MAG: AMP-binding protein [Pseudobdellovibrio sp.]
MINFDVHSKNQLLVNPKLGADEKQILTELQHEFESEFGDENYILVASSGSSKKNNESVKLIALQVNRVLNSANRVNKYLKATSENHWGLALPSFHVAGIGVYARAYLMQSKVFQLNWDVKTFAQEIADSRISYLSLVPTQVFDLVAQKVKSPSCLKVVFVGGGALNEELKFRFARLGWPVVETYGMTETSSMIAVREAEQADFRVMDTVSVKTENGALSIKCDSLLTAAIQKINSKIEIKFYDDNSWFKSEDQADLAVTNGDVFLKLRGRQTEYVKILGEGVSVSELREKLAHISLENSISLNSCVLISLPDLRSENKLVLIYEKSVSEAAAAQLMHQFNEKCRSYERIQDLIRVDKIPRTDLGKLKLEDLKHIIN